MGGQLKAQLLSLESQLGTYIAKNAAAQAGTVTVSAVTALFGEKAVELVRSKQIVSLPVAAAAPPLPMAPAALAAPVPMAAAAAQPTAPAVFPMMEPPQEPAQLVQAAAESVPVGTPNGGALPCATVFCAGVIKEFGIQAQVTWGTAPANVQEQFLLMHCNNPGMQDNR